MSIKSLNPYLLFNGNAQEAIAFYERTLGAKVEALTRFADVPEAQLTPEQKNRIMHAALRIGEAVLMLSDAMPSKVVATGDNFQVCLHFDDVADMSAKFDALAAGGHVSFPLHDTFGGATFGMLTDSLGIRWMFNCERPNGESPPRP